MENDKLHDCAAAYLQNSEYEYKIELYNSGTISEASFTLNRSHFMHLSGLEKLSDIINQSEISSSELLNKILDSDITYQDISESSFWGDVFNDPQKNGVAYTLDDRIDTLTNFRDVLNSSNVKAYSWNSDCHRTHRPYSSEIAADFMLVFEPENKKTPDERIYAFFKLDKNNPNIAHGMSQFPSDRTYNNDGRRSVQEIKIVSLVEHDKVNNVDRCIIEIPTEERQRLHEKVLNNSEYSTIKADLKQLRSKRTKYAETHSESAKKAYEKKLSVFSNRTIYNSDMLKNVAERLTAQAQDPHNSDVKDIILNEIKAVNAEIEKREKMPNTKVSSKITLTKETQNENGTMSVKLVTLETPQALTKAKSKIEKGTHTAESSIYNFFSDIKDKLKKAVSMFGKEKRAAEQVKKKPVKPERRTVKPTVPPISEKKYEQEKEPLFSIAEISSDKYAPTSSKDKDIGRTKNNNLEL
ncbi:MAG: PBECR4 domain-containing protein [Ruminococcus flavefaciens]|nr:PBECR4 domain-containing protein [Ruminococcus flavefaciens]MCM1059281.1 PBECR4 domain-containing protein [Eubacterium sp.]